MWTSNDIVDQTGRIVIVTGANSGIGYETALALFKAGAHVVLATRNAAKSSDALNLIQASGGKGTLETGLLDLASLSGVEAFTDLIKQKYERLDLLINNAGVMTPPESKTADGFELQFGVNFLGHFALTAQLYPLLKKSPNARVVTLSSGAHKLVQQIDFENLRSEKSYDANREYAISKLAGLEFTLELQRRILKAGDSIISTAAHPGVTQTDLSRHMSEQDYNAALAQFKELMPAWQGALPTLFAATSPTVTGGSYYGPDGENELYGYPALAQISNAARNVADATKLWNFAETVIRSKFLV